MYWSINSLHTTSQMPTLFLVQTQSGLALHISKIADHTIEYYPNRVLNSNSMQFS